MLKLLFTDNTLLVKDYHVITTGLDALTKDDSDITVASGSVSGVPDFAGYIHEAAGRDFVYSSIKYKPEQLPGNCLLDLFSPAIYMPIISQLLSQ